MLFSPFDALVPTPALAAQVISPPYDVMNTVEAARMAYDKPLSLLHVTRSEIAFPPGANPYAPEIYEKARERFEALLAEGALKPAGRPIYGVYRLTMGKKQQTGLVGLASVAAYQADIIKKHEFTRPEKEDDRTRHISVTGAQTGPVFLACRAASAFSDALAAVTSSRAPDVDVLADGGVRHEAWWIAETAPFEELIGAMRALYICDGHHRAASAARVAELEGTSAASRFLAVVFPADQLSIQAYNRVVADLGPWTVETFLARLAEKFLVSARGASATPAQAKRLSMFLDGAWYGLTPRPELLAGIDADPVAGLDVSILQDHVLSPLLGITDPRRDHRVDFVGGIRGTAELEKRVEENGGGVAFSMYPTSLDELFAVADAGEVMPPKSTWFEPKLADGMFVNRVR